MLVAKTYGVPEEGGRILSERNIVVDDNDDDDDRGSLPRLNYQ
jgi:hypothetical protein